MDDTLDAAVEALNERPDLSAFLPLYEQTMKDAYSLFREQTFRKVNTGQNRRSPVNKLMMLTVSIILAKYSSQYRNAIDSGRTLIDELAIMLEDDEDLFNALTWSTNSKWNIESVFRKLKDGLFDKYLLANE